MLPTPERPIECETDLPPDPDAILSAARQQRDNLRDRLIDDGEDELAEILQRCQSQLTLVCTNCGTYKHVERRCRKRWCPVCARQISAKRVAKYAGAVERMRWPIFATWTRPNVPVLTIDHIRHMRRAHRRLRQRKWWGERVRGGICSIEITNIGNGWHPHAHTVLDCKWLAKHTPGLRPSDTHRQIVAKCKQAATEVAAEWAHALQLPRATVKIKRAYGPRDLGADTGSNQSIAVEVLKYAVKAADLITSPEPIGDVIRLLGGARLVSPFGSLYGVDLSDDDGPEIPRASCDCGACKSLVPEEVIKMWRAYPV